MKNCHKAAENAKINAVLNTRKQLLVSDENIRIRDRLKYFRTPHVIRSTLMPSIFKSELVWLSYGLWVFDQNFLVTFIENCLSLTLIMDNVLTLTVCVVTIVLEIRYDTTHSVVYYSRTTTTLHKNYA